MSGMASEIFLEPLTQGDLQGIIESFVRAISRLMVDSLHRGSVMQNVFLCYIAIIFLVPVPHFAVFEYTTQHGYAAHVACIGSHRPHILDKHKKHSDEEVWDGQHSQVRPAQRWFFFRPLYPCRSEFILRHIQIHLNFCHFSTLWPHICLGRFFVEHKGPLILYG